MSAGGLIVAILVILLILFLIGAIR